MRMQQASAATLMQYAAQRCCLVCPAARGNWTLRHSNGAIYTLSTRPANFSAAQAACLAQGSHLVSYTSAAEQADVEQYFTTLGGLLRCWPGLRWLLARPAVVHPCRLPCHQAWLWA